MRIDALISHDTGHRTGAAGELTHSFVCNYTWDGTTGDGSAVVALRQHLVLSGARRQSDCENEKVDE